MFATYYYDVTPFWDRSEELSRIRRHLGSGTFGYVTGRRRVGKTALLKKAVEHFDGLYHQAIEGTAAQQLLHVVEEFGQVLPIFREVAPRTWSEFLRLLSRERLPRLLVFDEFPYWTQGNPSLLSLFQKWVDHDLPKLKTAVLVSGSSQSMLYSQFLNQGSPLYGRASLHLNLTPMSYGWFCRALAYAPASPDSFVRFSCVGGVPHYWKLLPRKGSVLQQVQALYFEPSAILAEEPTSLLRDEGGVGALPKAILDLVGRGVTKPSELAGRLGMVQGNLSRPLALLLHLGLIHRDIPFGESPRTTKKVLYYMQDPALSFYYGTYLVARSRWEGLAKRERLAILQQHVARHWEQFCRKVHPGAGRYWEGDVEIDLVCPQQGKDRYLVAECKWTRLTPQEEARHLRDLREKFQKTRLARRLKEVAFRIFSQNDLPRLAERT